MPIVTQRYLFMFECVNLEPDAAGVYALYDAHGNVIYYGMSETSVRGRLLSHLNGREGRCTANAYSYNTEIRTDAAAREAQLLREHALAFGRLPSCNSFVP